MSEDNIDELLVYNMSTSEHENFAKIRVEFIDTLSFFCENDLEHVIANNVCSKAIKWLFFWTTETNKYHESVDDCHVKYEQRVQ